VHLVDFYYEIHGFMLHVYESKMQSAFANVERLHFALAGLKFSNYLLTHTESVKCSVTLFCIVRYTPGFKNYTLLSFNMKHTSLRFSGEASPSWFQQLTEGI
jgi:hypothetical protein